MEINRTHRFCLGSPKIFIIYTNVSIAANITDISMLPTYEIVLTARLIAQGKKVRTH